MSFSPETGAKFRELIERLADHLAKTGTPPPDDDRPPTPGPHDKRVWLAHCHCPARHTIAMELFLLDHDPAWDGDDGFVHFQSLPRKTDA